MPAEPGRVGDRPGQAAQAPGLFEVVDQVGAQDPVGQAVDAGGDDRAVQIPLQVRLFDGTVLSRVSRNLVPIAIPAAPYASAAASPLPSKKPPAAITGMPTASSTLGRSRVVATPPV